MNWAQRYTTIGVFALIFILFVVMGTRMIISARSSSATTDEAIHILSGYLALKGDYRLNPEHPMLGKMIAAAPHLLFHTPLPDLAQFNAVADNFYYDSWFQTRATANRWLYESGLNPQDVLWPSRLVLIVATLALGVGLVGWSWKRLGLIGAVIVTGLYTTDPTLLAHGPLANTDIWSTIGFILTILAFVSYAEQPNRWRLAWLALAIGIALNLKYSLIIVVPILAVAWVVARWYFRRPIVSYGTAVMVCFLGWAVVTAIAYAGDLHAVAFVVARGSENLGQEFLGLGPLIQWLAPAQYWKGMFMVLKGASDGRPAYLLGHVDIGWWYYFPIALLVKQSVVFVAASIGLIGIGLFRIRRWTLTGSILAIAVVAYWLVAMKSQLTLGIRHILPALVLSMILIAGGISAWWKAVRTSSRLVAGVALGIALLFTEWSLSRVHPFYIPYFNELIGGSTNGHRVLADSNLDWGQALPQLHDWLAANNVQEPILLDYTWTGPMAPTAYGIAYEPLTADNQQSQQLIAVSRAELVAKPAYTYLRNQTPTALIGNAIAIFDQRTK